MGSIYSSRVVVNLGSRWRLGDGKSVLVWRDSWLKGRKDALIRSPVVLGKGNVKVKELWNATTDRWNEVLVDSLFDNSEAMLIEHMSLNNVRGDDNIVWWRNRNNMYLVRFVYVGWMSDLIDCTTYEY